MKLIIKMYAMILPITSLGTLLSSNALGSDPRPPRYPPPRERGCTMCKYNGQEVFLEIFTTTQQSSTVCASMTHHSDYVREATSFANHPSSE